MELYVKFAPVEAGTSQLVDEPFTLMCPPDVVPDTLLNFLTRMLGAAIDTAWTSTDRHPRIEAGWVFPGVEASETEPAIDVIAVPLVKLEDGSLAPMFELLGGCQPIRTGADVDSGRLAASRASTAK